MAGDAGKKKEAARKERTAGLKSSEVEKGGSSRGEGIDVNNDPDPDPSIELDNSPSRQAKKTPRARISPGFPVGNRNRNRCRADPSSRTRKPPALKGAPPMSFYHHKAGTSRILYRLNPKFGKDFTHTVGPLYAADPDPLEAPIPFRRARAGAGAGAGPVYQRSIWTPEDMDSLAEVMAGYQGVPLSITVWNAASAALKRSPDSCRNYYRDHTVDIDTRIGKALGEREREKEKHRHREEGEEEEEEHQHQQQPPQEEHQHRLEESITSVSVQTGKKPITESLSDDD